MCCYNVVEATFCILPALKAGRKLKVAPRATPQFSFVAWCATFRILARSKSTIEMSMWFVYTFSPSCAFLCRGEPATTKDTKDTKEQT